MHAGYTSHNNQVLKEWFTGNGVINSLDGLVEWMLKKYRRRIIRINYNSMHFETVIDKATKSEHEVKANKTGENQQPCPICSQDRKKKNNACMSYNSQTGLGHCSHCGASFYR